MVRFDWVRRNGIEGMLQGIAVESVELPKPVAQAVFDIATESMDFASGFLDNEEVEALRQYASLIGVDPILATPTEFHQTYYGHKERRSYARENNSWSCVTCHEPKEETAQ